MNEDKKIFLKEVEDLLMTQYLIGIGDCTNEDTIEASRVAGETPQEFVDGIGSKYNLDRIDTKFI